MFDPVAYINEPRWRSSRLGLDRMRELLERLGRPQDRLKFVHVAGTNGKGSTCAFLAAIFQAAGYRTGLFTSPFIEEFEERIRVDGKNVSADDLLCVTLAVREQAELMDDHPTEFELMCAVALTHFAQQSCDIVVLEVGLGGRLDATNVIDAPEACVIARIGLDHTALLGTTLAAIAGEKAGIIKPGVPVVSYPQEPEAMEVISRAASAANATLTVPDFSQLKIEPFDLAAFAISQNVSRETFVCDASNSGAGCMSNGGMCGTSGCGGGGASGDVHSASSCGSGDDRQAPFAFRSFSYGEFCDLRTALLGSYQPRNAALAIEAVRVLRARGWRISDDAVREGIAAARWPGRFEVVARRPLFIIDGGHNPQGVHALADTLNDVLPNKRVVFIIGVLEDKDYPSMLETVLPLGSAFITLAPSNPRALSAGKLARAIRWTGQDLLGCSACVRPYEAKDAADAVSRAREVAGADGVIVAFGSLYSVAALKAAL